MKVDRFDTDVRVEGVLVEENRTACKVGHVEPTSTAVMVDIFRCLLQGNDMPPSCNLLFGSNCIFLSMSDEKDRYCA